MGIFALLLWVALPDLVSAQVPEYQLKAEFLERFTRFIDWPQQGGDPTTPFVIGVYGGNPFGRYLDDLTSRTIKGKPVKVREVQDPTAVEGCHVLFISAPARQSVGAIIARTAEKPILTVSDSEGFAEKGVIINFYSLDSTIAFEINEAAARRSGLKFSSRLMKLARIVEQEARP